MSEFDSDWWAWRAAREARLTDPNGWLSVTSIHWLDETPRRFTDAPGVWRADGGAAVTVILEQGEVLVRDGDELRAGTHRLGPLDEEGERWAFDAGVLEVALREPSPILRPRRPDAANLQGYRDTPCYPPDRRWVVSATFTSYDEPDGEAIGEVTFSLEGRDLCLVCWGSVEEGLWILLRDGTSGDTTYAAARQLSTDAPTGARVSLDFNRVMNLPCAYTDFATCPVAPPANVLPFALEAGERLPRWSS